MENQGVRLKKIIRKYGFTNKSFANKVSVSTNYISMLIRGERDISDSFLFKVKKAIPYADISYIINGDNNISLFEQEKQINKQTNTKIMENAEFRRIRKYLDLTQQELAEKIGITRQTIGEYESTANIPKAIGMLMKFMERDKQKRAPEDKTLPDSDIVADLESLKHFVKSNYITIGRLEKKIKLIEKNLPNH